MAKQSGVGEIARRCTRHKVTRDSVRIENPLGLGPERMRVLRDVARTNIEVLNATHWVQHDRDLIRIGRKQPFTFIYLPLRGRIEWRSGPRKWTVEPGQVIFAGANQPQGAVNLGKQIEVISIHSHIRVAAAIPDQPLFRDMVQPLPHAKFWHEKMDAMVTLHPTPAFGPAVDELLRHLLFDLVLHGAKLLPYRRAIDPRIEQAMEAIRTHVADPSVLRRACRAASLSDSRLRVLFGRELGISPKKYHGNMRLREAVKLLSDPAWSLKEIASRLGYANQQHFDKDFKRSFHMAPGRYREAL